MKGHITILSPLAVVANVFVRTWPHLKNVSLGPHESAPKQYLKWFTRFSTAHLCAEITDTHMLCCYLFIYLFI